MPFPACSIFFGKVEPAKEVKFEFCFEFWAYDRGEMITNFDLFKPQYFLLLPPQCQKKHFPSSRDCFQKICLAGRKHVDIQISLNVAPCFTKRIRTCAVMFLTACARQQWAIGAPSCDITKGWFADCSAGFDTHFLERKKKAQWSKFCISGWVHLQIVMKSIGCVIIALYLKFK